MSYETIILEKLENLKQVCLDVNKEEANVFVRCDPFFSLVAGDGYNEIDFLFSLMIEPNIERKIVLMFTKVTDGERVFIRELDDENAWKRSRKYCAGLGKDNYYGLSNGLEVIVRSLDPAIRFESTVKFEEIASLLRDIISEERRIKDSEQFTQTLKDYFSELQPYVHSSLTNLLKDEEFRKSLARFLEPIGMAPKDEELLPDTVSMISQQATYLLLDKTLFLALLNESRDQLLPKLLERGDKNYTKVFKQLSEPLPEISGEDPKEWATRFWDALEEKFRLIRLINYEPIFNPEASPLNEVSLRGDPGGCLVLKEILTFLYGKERLAKLFDGPLLSRIYEGLIPPELRWKWGQIYTPPEVTRLIAEWGIKSPEDRVLDPACGTGRFLVSAYNKLRELKRVRGEEPSHQELLNQIYGIDINQFPAHLATMSLVALDLTSVTDEVNIKVSDFFHYQNYMQAKIGGEERKKIRVVGQTQIGRKGIEGQSVFSTQKWGEVNRSIGPYDVILMNPPYTRHEALGKYMEDVRRTALVIARVKAKSTEISMSKRAGYYVYFMTHGTNFLKEDGNFGMIVQNSWLDVDYGANVQQFLLENYKIIGIIGCSKERLIKTADVNTVILLLQKCTGRENAKKRKNNITRFVDLKRSLNWFENNYGFRELIEFIERVEEDYVDRDVRVIVKTQKELWEEGVDEKTRYIGSKWGKYLRAPDIFFEIVATCKKKLVPVSCVADVGTYLNTGGVNDFFFVKDITTQIDPVSLQKEFSIDCDQLSKEKLRVIEASIVEKKAKKSYRFLIEEEFLVPLLKSSSEVNQIRVSEENLELSLVRIPYEKSEINQKMARKYIEWGEQKNFHKRSGSKRRKPWYRLPSQAYEASPILFGRNHADKHIVAFNPDQVISDRFYRITPRSCDPKILTMLLNSTLGALFKEVYGRVNLGLGALDTGSTDIKRMLIVDTKLLTNRNMEGILRLYEKMSERKITSIFEEIGSDSPENVSLDKVKPDRRELDEIIMGEILGLSKREQLEVYRGVVHLVKERLEKAQTGD